jgi:nitroimidazol reductase NimA-like FMN-containing flavoprotein (pyridoxamine 5'-phosphate oxidase superfamily)
VVEELERDCCLRLLATGTVGRLAVAQPGGAPYLVPVNYTMVLRDPVSRARMSE